MTGNEIFKLGVSLIMEKVGEDPDSQYFTPMFLTIALQDIIDYENAFREAKGVEPLTEAPIIHDLSTDIDYDPKLTRVALPYLLASHYFRDNNDAYHEQFFFQLYQNAVAGEAPYVVGTVTDYYGG